MRDLLESELRAAFATRLATLEPAREARLRAFDYRSRTVRRRRLLAAVGASGTAITAGAATAVLLLTSSPSTAYARWSPHASAVTPAALSATTSACSKKPPPTFPQAPAPTTVPVTTDEAVLSETRGAYTAVIYNVQGTTYLCVSDGAETYIAPVSPTVGGVGVLPGQSGYVAPGPDQLTVLHNSPLIPGYRLGFNGGAIVNTIGVVGSDVSAVGIDLADGTTVDATVQNGWYLAWWPVGPHAPTSVQVTTTSGQIIQSAWPCPTGSDSCPFVDQPKGWDQPAAGSAGH